MSAVVYESLREAIAHPHAHKLTADGLQETLCPHQPPADQLWPTPSVFVQARLLLSRLPHRQQIICAVTAAELVLPLWEQWAAEHGGKLAGMPGEALGQAYRWLSHERTRDQLDKPIHAAEAAAEAAGRLAVQREGLDSRLAYVARLAAEAVDNAVYAASCAPDDPTMLRADRALQAVAKAARAVTHYEGATGYDYGRVCADFLHRWWNRCRCRLAVRDADTADLHWTH